jgi:site-specific DNA-methyltransferase (cytosine-N4-specific)
MIYNHSSESMHEVEDKSVHLVVTSPPYPMIAKWDELPLFLEGREDELINRRDFYIQHSRLQKIWLEVKRVLVDGGIACINIGDATRSIDGEFCCYPNFAMLSIHMMNMGFTPLVPIIWRKISNRPNAFLGSGMLPPNGYIAQDCEYIGIYRKGNKRKFTPHDLQRYASEFSKDERDRWFQQIWQIPGAMGAKETSAFPTEVPFRLIQMFSCIDEVVLDPFSGTGTTSKVCEKLERKFIGYEVRRD